MSQLSLLDPMEENEHARAARRAQKLRKELDHHNRLYHQRRQRCKIYLARFDDTVDHFAENHG